MSSLARWLDEYEPLGVVSLPGTSGEDAALEDAASPEDLAAYMSIPSVVGYSVLGEPVLETPVGPTRAFLGDPRWDEDARRPGESVPEWRHRTNTFSGRVSLGGGEAML